MFHELALCPLDCGHGAHEGKFVIPVRRLASNPSLDHLRHRAKDLLKQHSARLPDTVPEIRVFHPRLSRASDADATFLVQARSELKALQAPAPTK